MKYIYTILFTASLTLLLKISFGQSKKVCHPISVIFEKFQKKSLNLSGSTGMSRSNIERGNYFNFNGQVGINYFPIKYLELGMRVKPTFANSKTIGNTTLLENNLYVRYYPFLASCSKTALLTGASILRDGAEYSVKGEPISKNKLFPSLNAGFIVVPKKYLQLEFYSDYFLNRPVRHNAALVWYFKSYKLN